MRWAFEIAYSDGPKHFVVWAIDDDAARETLWATSPRRLCSGMRSRRFAIRKGLAEDGWCTRCLDRLSSLVAYSAVVARWDETSTRAKEYDMAAKRNPLAERARKRHFGKRTVALPADEIAENVVLGDAADERRDDWPANAADMSPVAAALQAATAKVFRPVTAAALARDAKRR